MQAPNQKPSSDLNHVTNQRLFRTKRFWQTFSWQTSWYFCLLLFLLAGCSDPNRMKLVGTWEIQEADNVADQIDSLETTDPQTSAPKMSLQFLGSGQLKTVTVMGNINREKEGTWEFESFDEDSETSKITCTIGLQETSHEIRWIKDDVIELVPPNMAGVDLELQFKKK